jgi:hypothetical protein
VGCSCGEELFVRGVLCGEGGGDWFDGAAGLVELAESAGEVGDEEGEGIAEGSVELADDFDTGAVLDFEEALLFKAFGGLADYGATDAELLGEGALCGEPGDVAAVLIVESEDEVGEASADLFD